MCVGWVITLLTVNTHSQQQKVKKDPPSVERSRHFLPWHLQLIDLNTREKRGRVSPHFAKNDCSLKMVDLVPPLPFLVKKVLQFILPQLCALPFSILYLPNSITLISIPQLMTTGPCTQSHNRWDFRIKTDWHSWLIADIIEPNKGSASVHGRLKLVQLPESSGVSRPGSGPSSFSKP